MSIVLVKEITHKSEEALKKIKENTKQEKKQREKMDTSYFNLEKLKLKYQKRYHDWKDSEINYQIADQDGTLSRNEILKMKLQAQAKLKLFEASTVEYSSKLDITNVEQKEYFEHELPSLVNSLQDVDREKVELVRRVVKRCLAGEMEMLAMVIKCSKEVEKAVGIISVEIDQEIVVER